MYENKCEMYTKSYHTREIILRFRIFYSAYTHYLRNTKYFYSSLSLYVTQQLGNGVQPGFAQGHNAGLNDPLFNIGYGYQFILSKCFFISSLPFSIAPSAASPVNSYHSEGSKSKS